MAPLTSLTTALLFSSLASASTIQFNIARNPAAEEAQLTRRQLTNLYKRAGTVNVALTNAENQGLYFANVTVGTPGQNLALQIDTGSSDVWVPSTTASLCGNAKEGGCPNGAFNSKSSTSFQDVETNGFNISYVDGTGSTGDYFQDTFKIGGATLNNFEMGLALDTTIGTGIMGIGYNTSEANIDTGNGTEYPNLPLAMVNAGAINSAAYSLWLNDLQATTGSILFGGIDTAKYSGDLISIKVYPDSQGGRTTSFTVAFTSLSATSSSGTDQLTPANYATAAILDSGTTITLLPDDIATSIFEELGATVSQQLGAVVVPCALAENSGTINYGFGGTGGPTIKVAVSQLVLPLTLTNGRTPTYTNGQAACQLGIQAAGDLPVLFGDTFLRSAYVVYDLENNRIALAQTDFNSTSSNVVSFASQGAPIPSATTAANEDQVTQTATGVPKVGTTGTADGTAAATYNPTATGLNAANGFAATSTSTSTGSKKNAAGAGPEPFAWSRVVVAGVSLALAGVGGGVFTLL
ncbi:related to acid proteinase PEPI precursor [Phialocephala subalpina]|uniref:Probable aspartic-type endopeptidase OPSB n=1 Tax=Phialocephala subalpina TaxID=576137 RepID=A0A1L7WSQ2_9HELO|nr:related to acid proteinase PEPI precursor [Phialocephala subalpina]